MADGFEAVGYHDYGLIRSEGFNGGSQFPLVFWVNISGGLIQDNDGCILHNSAGNGNALLLPAGKARAALADDGVIPRGSFMMKSWQHAFFAASMTRSMGASGWQKRMLLATVS